MPIYETKKTPGNTDWFVHDRFGMFIHFGLFSMPARHEWVKRKEKMSDEQYQVYFDHFDPDLYDPKDWARRAKAAGMKYAVLTTKHHEGFCLFDSAYTDFKVTNTAAGRDLVREYVEAFRAEGLKVGLYYSLLDWHHPDFTIDRYHPLRDHPDAEALNEGRDMHRYAEYMRNQVRELMTNYGRIDILWFDFSYGGIETDPRPWVQQGKRKEAWESEELIAMVRSLQPGIVINSRSGIEQDTRTPEQYQPTQWVRHKETGERIIWETCQTFSGSWGYHRDEATWKSPQLLIEMLIKTVACGGNLLMNVGPTSRGYLDQRSCDALDAYAQWMHYHSRSIYGCTMAEPGIVETVPFGCLYTEKEDRSRLYLHLLSYPFERLEIRGMAGKVAYAQFLHDGSEVRFTEGGVGKLTDAAGGVGEGGFAEGSDLLVLKLPPVRPNVTVPVIELFLK